MSSFIVDADVFAIMSRTSGESSKRHPFVVKNGSVYMNHALMDTAEIGSVIAKYINVQHLVGSIIEGGSFRGGDIWLGENPNGAFGAYGKRWNAGIDSNGRFYGSDVYFTSGTFQGNVLANSGTMNNVTIRENCTILGRLNANQITGDIVRTYALNLGADVHIPSMPFHRRCSFMLTVSSGSSTTTAWVYINGVAMGSLTARDYGIGQGTTMSNNFEFTLWANTEYTIKYDRDNKGYPYASSSCLAIVCMA